MRQNDLVFPFFPWARLANLMAYIRDVFFDIFRMLTDL